MDELTEQIDRYLNNALPDEKRKAFEMQIEQDEELAKAVRLQQKTADLLEAHVWLTTKESVAALNDRKPSSISFILKIAAVFIGIILASYFMISSQYSDAQLYSEYHSPYPDRITTMSSVNDDLIKAMEYYNQANYEMATKQLSIIRKKGKGNDQVRLYEAIALTQIGEPGTALELLEIELLQSNLEEAYAWQRILSLLANGEGDKAYADLLLYLEMEYTYNRSKAENLKQDMESRWR